MGIKVVREGQAALLILDWPEVRNALSVEAAREICSALALLAADPDIRGLVLTGEGAFCAGANLKNVAERSASGMPEAERKLIVYGAMQGMIRALVDFPLPTVAAIDGPAIGLGFDLALACDSRFIGPNGWCMQGWGRIGVIPGTGGEYLLRIRAPGLLWRLLETQPRIDAVSAEHWNLGEATNGNTARQCAIARINAYAQMSRAALEAYVDLYRLDLRRDLDANLTAAVDRQVKLLANPDLGASIEKVMKKVE
jgi:2-(1,2-epoxy-1,2-dihydrophenyl)acetyl-CoA isomerase